MFHRKKHAEPEIEEPVVEETPDEEPGDSPPDPVGEEVLRDGPLFARWFMVYELQKEMERSRRYERPLSVMVLVPTPTLGHRPTDEAMLRAAQAAQHSARSTDIIGWLPGGGVMVVMPETDKDGAASAIYRWRNEMYTSTMQMGAVRWQVATHVNPVDYESAEDLLDAVMAQLVPADAA